MASGDTLAICWPEYNQPGTSAFSTYDIRNNQGVLNFNGGTNWSAIYPVFIPNTYAGGGVTCIVASTGGTATSGTMVWQTAFERIGTTQDIDSDSFATGNNGTIAAPGTSGVFNNSSINHSNGAQMDSLAAGEWGRLKLTRLTDDSSDNMGGTAQVKYVEIREQ